MKLSKEQVELAEDLARRTVIHSGYACLHIKRLPHTRSTEAGITSYGCGCCSRKKHLTEGALDNLIYELEDAVTAAKALKAMYDSGELDYSELLEEGEE